MLQKQSKLMIMSNQEKKFKRLFIGKEIVIEHNETLVSGKIIDETKETFKIKTNDGEKVYIKKNLKIINIDGVKTQIDGQKIAERSFDRIKLR